MTKSTKLQHELLAIGLLMLLAGCHAKNKIDASKLNDGTARNPRYNMPSSAPGRMAAIGKDTITTECEHESYANASKGLIVEEAGLHEDVFSLRDRTSLTPNAYDLNEALKLEALLHAEVNVPGHSAEQADCIDEFAEHLGGLTDSLVQADKVQKEMDLSAFRDASKQAEDQLEKKQHETEQPTTPSPR
jgi:hypothetical protein